MSPINIVVALVIITVIFFATRKVVKKKGSCGCGCESCHSSCAAHNIET